ncbi:AroM family protein [Microbacterium sp. 18062]|uniref:AroM family protein n=1 Tax=Microbacterium sp. 18062 TaxID=2681410 RepID=UPI0013568500|nr:AroM family protein [Microbacterium sp. 18062]
MRRTAPARLGIITTGGGPRPEYESFHARLLAGIGLPGVEVVSRHALDGLDDVGLRAIEPRDGHPAVHANVRSDAPGARTSLGDGWRDVWIDRSRFLDLVQRCIDELVAESVDAIIVCIAEELPGHVLVSPVPVIIPELAVAAAVESFVRTRRNTRIAVFCYSDRQRAQQLATWSRQPWMESASVAFYELGEGWDVAAEKAAAGEPHIGLLWGYGQGLIGGTGREVAEMREALGVPVLAPHVLAGLSARSFLPPQIEPQGFLA